VAVVERRERGLVVAEERVLVGERGEQALRDLVVRRRRVVGVRVVHARLLKLELATDEVPGLTSVARLIV
jgi:hypothetical protein